MNEEDKIWKAINEDRKRIESIQKELIAIKTELRINTSLTLLILGVVLGVMFKYLFVV